MEIKEMERLGKWKNLQALIDIFLFSIFTYFYIIKNLFSLNTLDRLSGVRIKPTLLSRQPGFSKWSEKGLF